MTYDFRKNIINGTLHHAFIIEGPYSADKKNYAVELAQAILCRQMPGVGCGECVICRKLKDGNHLDFVFIEPYAKKGSKTRSVKDEQIEQLQERLMRKPFEGDRVIAVIDGADTVTARAFNRFLKTLEEPPEGTVIFLLSENAAKLPQTIRSRCVHVRLYGNEGKDNMNCIKCGASLVKGQTICSICGTTNSNNDYFSQHSSEIVNQYNQSNVGNMQYQEDYTDQKSIKKIKGN